MLKIAEKLAELQGLAITKLKLRNRTSWHLHRADSCSARTVAIYQSYAALVKALLPPEKETDDAL